MKESDLQKPVTGKDWFELGYKHLRAGRLPGALSAFKQSLKINHQMAAPWIGLSKALEMNGQFEEARECLRRAITVEPTHVDAHLQLATSHKNLGDVDDAKHEYEHTLSLDPKFAPAHFGLGQVMEDMGDPAAAAGAYRSALKLDPSYSEALANLLGLSRHIDVSEEVEMADNLLENASDRDKALIGYGLGKAHEQQKLYDAAFDAYATANVARSKLVGAFDPDMFAVRLEKMCELFSSSFFEEHCGWGDPSEQPVFIVGLPRSGTTLTEQIIGSHPDCFGAGELFTLTDLATATPDRLGKADPPWPFCAPDLNETHVKELALEYLDQSSGRAPDTAVRVVDKQPLNFWHLGLVAMALPNAKIIHCTRDIRDCGFSIFSQNFGLEQQWSTDLGHIADYWRGYKKLMEHWASVTNLQIMEVSYEDTVSDLEGQARHLLDFLGLSWDANVLNFHENDRAVQTPSRWQVRQPIYQSSKERWRRYEKKLGPLIEAVEAEADSE